MIRRAALILVAFAVFAPAAQASSPTFEQVVARSQTVALDYWAQHGTARAICSPVTMQLDSPQPNGSTGGSLPDQCLVELAPEDRTLTPPQVCAVVTHEYGHLGNMPHVDDPTSVMNPSILVVPAECAAAWHETCASQRRALLAAAGHARRNGNRAGARRLTRRARQAAPVCTWSAV